MPDYEKMYALMFNAATDALAALGHMDFGQARDILREAQREAEELYLTRSLLRILEEDMLLLSGAKKPDFSVLKADFDRRVAEMKSAAQETGSHLDNLFSFCDDVFPNGQELLILVTELTLSDHSARFIARYGCKAYFAHNKELLFYERQQELLDKLDELEDTL